MAVCKYLPHNQASTGNLCPVTINGCPRGKGVIASPDLAVREAHGVGERLGLHNGPWTMP